MTAMKKMPHRALPYDFAGLLAKTQPRVRSLVMYNTSGASAIEFALIIPLFIVILMAIIEFGMIFYVQNSIQSAARDIGRQLSTNRLAMADAPSAARKEIGLWLIDQVKVSVTQSAPTNPAANDITVDISVSALNAAPTNFLGTFYADTTLHGVATMRQEPLL